MTKNSKIKPESDRPTAPKQRKCLKCGQSFMSEHSGERICPRCKKKTGWR